MAAFGASRQLLRCTSSAVIEGKTEADLEAVALTGDPAGLARAIELIDRRDGRVERA
jgi:hypothetical protein